MSCLLVLLLAQLTAAAADDKLSISGKHHIWALVMQMLGEALAVLHSILESSKQATVAQTDNKTPPGCELPETDW